MYRSRRATSLHSTSSTNESENVVSLSDSVRRLPYARPHAQQRAAAGSNAASQSSSPMLAPRSGSSSRIRPRSLYPEVSCLTSLSTRSGRADPAPLSAQRG